jgi:hypothetical protein
MTGSLRKHLLSPTSKHGLYDTRELARLKRRIQQETTPEEPLGLDWLTIADLGNLYNLEYSHYGPDTGDPGIVQHWIKRNPNIGRILFHAEDRKDLWGAIILLPMPEATIMKTLRQDMHDVDLKPEQDLLLYDRPGSYDIYAASAIMREDKRQHFPLLLSAWFDFWSWQATRGLRIAKVYARILSASGEMMVKKLFFSPRYDINGNTWELDVSRPNPSRIVQSFQCCIKTSEEDKPDDAPTQ